MSKIELSNSEIEEIINGLDIAKGECNCYINIFKKFKEKFQNDLNILFVYEDGNYKILNNAYQLIGIQKQIMNKDIRPIGFAPLLYKKDKTYYLHGNPRHFSEEELNLNFWFFDEPINVNRSPEDDEILFYRHDIFELCDLLSQVFINNLNFYWNLKEEFPISCIKVCNLDENKYEEVVQKLIDLIKNTTDYDKKDIFIRSLSSFYSKISNKQLIIEAIKVTVKTFKDKKINEEKIIDWIEFIKIQHPYLDTYKLFENPDEYVQNV